MTMLHDSEIRAALDDGLVASTAYYVIEPSRVGPASLDLNIGDTFRRQRRGLLATIGSMLALIFGPNRLGSISARDGSAKKCWREEQTLGIHEEFVIRPGEFVLAETAQVIHMPDGVGGQVAARSTYGRIGQQVCGNAGFVDPGFEGTVTLELYNTGVRPIRLIRGERVLQLVMWRTDGASERPYGSEGLGSQYQGQRGPTVPGG